MTLGARHEEAKAMSAIVKLATAAEYQTKALEEQNQILAEINQNLNTIAGVLAQAYEQGWG